MKKVLIIFGTRPEAIKMCPVVKAFQNNTKIQTVVCVTGQHREMLKQVLDIFEIVPDYDLNIMIPNQTLYEITIDILNSIREVFLKEQPDLVLVHGDTSTTFVSALAAFYQKIPVGHVEAGLRTYNIYSPYPEEFNRQAVSLLAKFNFAPTETAAQQLINEGKDKDSIFITGNTVIDALKTTVQKNYKHEVLEWAKGSRLTVLTAHRRENLGEPLENIFRAVKRVVLEHPDIKVVYPIHLNPQIRGLAEKYFKDLERVRLINPLEVIDFHNILAKSYLVLTDSGGIQEEAPSLGKPVLVMRNTTERPEGLEAGTLKLVGTLEDDIYHSFVELLTNSDLYNKMSEAKNPYGDGNASERILNIVMDKL